MWKRFYLLLFVFGLLLFCCGASLQWNASIVDSEHAAPTGYRIHRGPAPGVYDWQIDVGLALQWPIPDDLYGSYYWAASAYNAAGQSGYSNEVYWTRAPQEPPQYVGATNLRASKLQQQPEQPMAVEYISTITINSDSQSITVPSDATFAVLSQLTWNSFDPSPPPVTLNSVSFTNVYIGGTHKLAVSYLVNPSIGTQTLVSQASGYWRRLSFFKGVNTSAPIADSGSGVVVDAEITGLSYSSGDMMVGFVGDYYGDPTLDSNSQTIIFQVAERGGAAYRLSVGEFHFPDGGTTITGMGAYAMILAASAVPANRGNIGMMLGMSNSMWLDNDFLKPVGGN